MRLQVLRYAYQSGWLQDRASDYQLAGPAWRWKLRNGPSTGRNPAVSLSFPRIVLAQGDVTRHDHLVVELVIPTDAPKMILIRWPAKPTVVRPIRFADVASAAMKVLASANVELTRRRAAREL